MSPRLEKPENWSKLGIDLGKTYRNACSKYAQPPRFKVGQKGVNNKKAGTPQQLKTNYCGPLYTENTYM
jgi:hypothetical protein